MNTGSRTQAAFIQGNQSTADQDAPHSALLYLFQEVSQLASPIHNRGGPFMVKEEGDVQSFSISNSSCQHSFSHLSNYNQIEKMNTESHSSIGTALVNLHPQNNSPWKVLGLINLQCERLLNPCDVEESGQSSASSVTKSGNSIDNALTQTEQGSNVLNELLKIPAVVSPGTDLWGACSTGADRRKPQFCVKKDSQMGCCVRSQTTENTLRSDLMEEGVPASSQPQIRETEGEHFSENRQLRLNQECNNSFSSMGNASSDLKGFNSKEDTSEILPKPTLTLDHNANITFTPEVPPQSVVLSASHSVSLLLNTAQDYQPLSKHDDKFAASEPDCSTAPSEDKSLPVAQPEPSGDCGETNPLDSATPELYSRPVLQEEFAPSSAQKWRTKTPRKQLHPTKSVDMQDPDFQGVMFRFDTELDDSREHCRLLVTSKYSKGLPKTVRKPRLRTRTALRSLKTISSDEESDSTTSASKDKVCASCCTRKTPMWRDAEDGTPLCNACGIRYKKYRVRCVNCWHIPRKESNSKSSCHKCGNSVKLTSPHRKHHTA